MKLLGILILSALGLSIGQFNAKKNGPTSAVLHRIIKTECSELLDASRLNTRIVSKNYLNDSLFLKISFSENCCLEFKPELLYKDSTLYITLNSKNQETFCECHCTFDVTFVITGLNDVAFRTVFNGNQIVLTDQYYKDTYPEKYLIMDNDTINRTNIYGHRVGTWCSFYDDSLTIKSCITYSGLTGIEKMDYMESHEYYPNGKLKSKCLPDSSLDYYQMNQQNYFDRLMYGFRTETFYENGQIKSDCFSSWSREQRSYIDSCQYWTESGHRNN